MTNQPESTVILTDFPKIECPFIRQTFKVDPEKWKQVGSKLKLRQPEVYLVVNKVNPGYAWVFEDEDTIAVEKLDGTNVKLLTEKGRLIAVANRKNPIDLLQVMKGKTFIIEGVFRSIDKDYLKETGEQAGEVIGPKLQGNPYYLDHHLWYPFEKAIDHLRYKSFHEHDRTFENWSAWFKDHLQSRFYTKLISKNKKPEIPDFVMAEGVIFYNLKRRAAGQSWMAKLRRDMWSWHYDHAIEIIDYQPEGKTEIEDQTKFD